jgi:hypothetical protein
MIAVSLRVVPLVAFAALIVVGAASASAPRRIDVAFATAPLGPRSTFASIARRATLPAIVLAARARRVGVIRWNGERSLLVAPTKAGGFCESLSGPYGGTGCFSGTRQRNRLDPGLTGDASGPIAFNGRFFDSRATQLKVRYADGHGIVVPIIWVSKPVDAGFFVFAIPDAHRRPGHRPLTITLSSAKGIQLARVQLPH